MAVIDPVFLSFFLAFVCLFVCSFVLVDHSSIVGSRGCFCPGLLWWTVFYRSFVGWIDRFMVRSFLSLPV